MWTDFFTQNMPNVGWKWGVDFPSASSGILPLVTHVGSSVEGVSWGLEEGDDGTAGETLGEEVEHHNDKGSLVDAKNQIVHTSTKKTKNKQTATLSNTICI